MKKKEILGCLLLFIVLTSIVIFKNKYIYCALWLVFALTTIFVSGFPRNKNFFKKSIIQAIFISVISYFIFIYALGLVVGFYRNYYVSHFSMAISYIFIATLLIISQEIVRFTYARKYENDLKKYILLTIIYVFLGIGMEFSANNVNSFESIFYFVCLTVIPIIANQILYSYLTLKTGFTPTFILRLFLELYIYIVPFLPDLGNYLTAVFGVLYPALIYSLTSKTIRHYDKYQKYLSTIRVTYIWFPMIIVLGILTYLISGIGKYQLISIASGSMEPIYYRGDAVLIEKTDNVENIQIGDIIAFKQNGVIITHRIVGIANNGYEYEFITKGDNNDTIDSFYTSNDDVIGTVRYVIKYIGRPTIWLNELFDNI